MPTLEISLPRVGREVKKSLATELTHAFCSTTGHAPEHMGIRFFEYEREDAAVGGQLCAEAGAASYLHLLVYCPRLSRATKQKMGAALSEVVIQVLSQGAPIIHICEHPYDNIVVDRRLLSDAYVACAKKRFYYPTED